jgi:choloylglycine hydrolase
MLTPPIGIVYPLGKTLNILCATIINQTNRNVYFKSAYNNTIRYIDLNKINFATVHYHATPMDKTKEQPMKEILIPSCCE